MRESTYAKLCNIGREPKPLWIYIVNRIILLKVKGAAVLSFCFLLTVYAWIQGMSVWFTIPLVLLLTNICYPLIAYDDLDLLQNFSRIERHWPIVIGQKFNHKFNCTFSDLSDRILIQINIMMVIVLLCTFIGCYLLIVQADWWGGGIALLAIYSVLSAGSLSQLTEKLKLLAQETTPHENKESAKTTVISVNKLSGRNRQLLSLQSNNKRTLFQPNCSCYILAIRWRIITSIGIIAVAVQVISSDYMFFFNDLFGITAIPTIFLISTVLIGFFTKAVFNLRDNHFNSVCLRRFESTSGHCVRTIIAPTLSCFGKVSVVSDMHFQENPGALDELAESNEFDPMSTPFYLPNLLLNSVILYEFKRKNWKTQVSMLLEWTDLIVVDISNGISPSIEWEIDESMKYLPIERILFISNFRKTTALKLIEQYKQIDNKGNCLEPQLIMFEDSWLGRLKLKNVLVNYLKELD